MSLDPNYDLSSADDLDLNTNSSSNDIDSNVDELSLDSLPSEDESPKQKNKRNYLAKKRIEQIKEERRLQKLIDDDWD